MPTCSSFLFCSGKDAAKDFPKTPLQGDVEQPQPRISTVPKEPSSRFMHLSSQHTSQEALYSSTFLKSVKGTIKKM